MAKFLNTSATNYFLEELIKNARERLIIISPFLKLNDRIKELLEDKNRMKLDIRVVYGKSELQPEEISWLRSQEYIRTSFCKNLHAKCYMNEQTCIITSLNLYEFSQINNNEMGVLIERDADGELYKDAYEESLRLIRVSDEIRINLEKITPEEDKEEAQEGTKLTSSRLAVKHGLKTAALIERLINKGLLEQRDGKPYLTDSGKQAGGEFKFSSKHGAYFIWPETLEI